MKGQVKSPSSQSNSTKRDDEREVEIDCFEEIQPPKSEEDMNEVRDKYHNKMTEFYLSSS